MTITSISPARLLDIASANAIATVQRAASSSAQNAFSSYQPPTAQEVRKKDNEREKPVLDFTLEGVATSVIDLGDGVRHALDDLASKIQGLKVQRISIDGYDPVLRMIGDARAQAVMDYLNVKGVDKNLMSAEGHWRKPWDPDFKLADRHCVVIKVYGRGSRM